MYLVWGFWSFELLKENKIDHSHIKVDCLGKTYHIATYPPLGGDKGPPGCEVFEQKGDHLVQISSPPYCGTVDKGRRVVTLPLPEETTQEQTSTSSLRCPREIWKQFLKFHWSEIQKEKQLGLIKGEE